MAGIISFEIDRVVCWRTKFVFKYATIYDRRLMLRLRRMSRLNFENSIISLQ